MDELTRVDCTLEKHGAAILAILNEAILSSTALYDYQPRTAESMTTWFAAKQAGGFPVIGFENENGELVGFASYGNFRAFPAYKYTVEHSVYVHKDHRGKGLGNLLLSEVIEASKLAEKHVLIGAIDANNAASIKLHEKFDFEFVGKLPEVGFKFGAWLDLVLYQLTLTTPHKPKDG